MRAVSAVTELGASSLFIGLRARLCTAEHGCVHRPLSISPCVTDFLCAVLVAPKNVRMQNFSSHFSLFYGEDGLLYGVIETGTAEPQPDTQLLALSK